MVNGLPKYTILYGEMWSSIKSKNKEGKYVLLRFLKNYFYDRGGSFVFTWNKYNLRFL